MMANLIPFDDQDPYPNQDFYNGIQPNNWVEDLEDEDDDYDYNDYDDLGGTGHGDISHSDDETIC